MIGSYPTVFVIGHSAIQDIFSSPVLIEEKIDGSQFSFCRAEDLHLQCRSKNAEIFMDAPMDMFKLAMNTLQEIYDFLHIGWVYRCEYLQKPKHNTLAYNRVPNRFLIGFDIMIGGENYLPYEEKCVEFERLGLECVPRLFEGKVNNISDFNALLDTDSILGGTKIEGVVVKNYNVFTVNKKIAIGKYVSEQFKEVNQVDWKSRNLTGKDFVGLLVEKYRTTVRWEKAVQHLRESGNLEDSPQDIGNLIKEVSSDIKAECESEIKQQLFDHAWPQIQRGIVKDLPEWYKQQLVTQAFGEKG